ncbi:MAG: hypothetical protein P1P84_11995 [Deferrisomatales bacterium]|nr:hypothetical protein [Deferrisomatales bacterium]
MRQERQHEFDVGGHGIQSLIEVSIPPDTDDRTGFVHDKGIRRDLPTQVAELTRDRRVQRLLEHHGSPGLAGTSEHGE